MRALQTFANYACSHYQISAIKYDHALHCSCVLRVYIYNSYVANYLIVNITGNTTLASTTTPIMNQALIALVCPHVLYHHVTATIIKHKITI